jgi:hypothetical protein
LLDKMKYEADYGQCVKKSKSKEEALTCLARWEAAASEYHKEEIAFTSEIERRDLDAIDVINQQLSSLTARRARMRQGSTVVSAKEQAAVYQGSLDRLKAAQEEDPLRSHPAQRKEHDAETDEERHFQDEAVVGANRKPKLSRFHRLGN